MKSKVQRSKDAKEEGGKKAKEQRSIRTKAETRTDTIQFSSPLRSLFQRLEQSLQRQRQPQFSAVTKKLPITTVITNSTSAKNLSMTTATAKSNRH